MINDCSAYNDSARFNLRTVRKRPGLVPLKTRSTMRSESMDGWARTRDVVIGIEARVAVVHPHYRAIHLTIALRWFVR